MHETYLQNEKEFDEKYWGEEGELAGCDGCELSQRQIKAIKIDNRNSLIKVMKALADELEREREMIMHGGKLLPYQTNNTPKTGSEYYVEGRVRALQLAIDKIDNFINKIQ